MTFLPPSQQEQSLISDLRLICFLRKRLPFLRVFCICLLITAFTSSVAQVKTAGRPRVLNNHDGRFTLGNEDKRLMYGFPIPTSTSHFVIKLDSVMLTNNPDFNGYKSIVYIKGKSTETGMKTKVVETEYKYQKFKIIQRLIPADKTLKEITGDLPAQYYIARYEVINLSEKAVKAGLLLLFDTMIDDNDCCQMKINDKLVDECTAYAKAAIPASVLLYHAIDHPEDQMGDFRPVIDQQDKPDSMFVGNWPLLHSIHWNMVSETGKYTDSGILLKWNVQKLEPKMSMKHAAAYGIPPEKTGDVKLLLNAPDMQTLKRTIYFDIGKWDLDLNASMVIEEILNKSSTIKGVVIHGYSDAAGTTENAMHLSDKRIEKVARIFEKKGIPSVPKSHGNQMADFSEDSKKQGNAWDRKVVIEVYY